MNDLLSGLLTNWLSDLIKVGIVAGLTILFTKVNSKYPDWGTHVKYGLMCFALLAISLFAMTGRPLIDTQPPAVTPSNVEAFVQKWADSTDLSLREMPKSDSVPYTFAFEATFGNGIRVMISQPKFNGTQIFFQSQVDIPPADKTELQGLSSSDLTKIQAMVSVEMARSKLEFDVNLPSWFRSQSYASISTLSSDALRANVGDVANCMVAASNTLKLSLQQVKENKLTRLVQPVAP